MKRFQLLGLQLAYLLLTVLVSWLLLFALMFNSTSSKYSHLIRNYDEYKGRIEEAKADSLKALADLKLWKSKHSDANQSLLFDSSDSFRYICVGLPSRRRIGANVNVAAQSIAAFLTRTQFRLRDRVLFRVINVEQNPADNQFLNQDLKDLVKVVNISAGIKNLNLRLNEAMDYAFIWRHLHSLSCNYSLVLEDDAIISYDWYYRLDEALQSRLGQSKDWLYLKLFTGYKLFDWDWLAQPWVILKVLMFSTFLYIVQYVIVHAVFPTKRVSMFTLFLIFVNSAALVVVYNTTCVNPIGAGVHPYTTGFGTVSVLVPQYHILNLSRYLETYVKNYIERNSGSEFQAKDLLIDKYRIMSEALELVIEPSLVQHVGIFSSVYLRDTTNEGYQRMFKSFSFVSHFRPIYFDPTYSLS